MNKNKWMKLLSVAWLMACFLVLCVFIAKEVDFLLDSDMSSELILAKLLSKGNGILSREWYYSTELRVLNTQLVYALVFRFIGNWHLVRVISSIVLSLLLLISYYYFCVQAGIKKYFCLSASVFLLPFCAGYFDFVLLGSYYIPHIVVSLLTVGMFLQFRRIQKKGQKLILLFVMILLSVLAGMGGPRQIIILNLPLLCTVLVSAFLERKSVCRTEMRDMLLFSVISFLASGIGYGINSAVLSKVFYFKTWDYLAFKDFSFGSLEQVINGLLQGFGYESGEIFSETMLLNAIALVLLVTVTVSVLSGLKEKNDKNYRFIALFFLVTYVVYTALYCVTTLTYKHRYNIPIIIFGIPLVCLALKCSKLAKKQYFAMGLVLLMALSGAIHYNVLGKVDKTQEYRAIVETVSKKGYREGYASFWNSNVLTELSNGEIEMRTWMNVGMNTLEELDTTFEWLQTTTHSETKPQGSVFLLLSASEMETCPLAGRLSSERIIYQSGSYSVYGYDSYEEARTDCEN